MRTTTTKASVLAAWLLSLIPGCSIAVNAVQSQVAEKKEKAEESIGVATMKDDGTIVLRLRAKSPSGALGEGTLTYPPTHPEYRNILSHIGPIRPGQSVSVRPWPDQ